jgi:hypothetical protein
VPAPHGADSAARASVPRPRAALTTIVPGMPFAAWAIAAQPDKAALPIPTTTRIAHDPSSERGTRHACSLVRRRYCAGIGTEPSLPRGETDAASTAESQRAWEAQGFCLPQRTMGSVAHSSGSFLNGEKSFPILTICLRSLAWNSRPAEIDRIRAVGGRHAFCVSGGHRWTIVGSTR